MEGWGFFYFGLFFSQCTQAGLLTLLHNVLAGEQSHIWLIWAPSPALLSVPLILHPSCQCAVVRSYTAYTAFISTFQFLF